MQAALQRVYPGNLVVIIVAALLRSTSECQSHDLCSVANTHTVYSAHYQTHSEALPSLVGALETSPQAVSLAANVCSCAIISGGED